LRVVANPPFNAVPSFVLPVQEASCSAGRVAIGGGFELVGSAQQLTVLSSAPANNGVAGWRVTVKNYTSGTLFNAQVRVHVTCAIMQ
jgi:hypothetical protein